MKLKKRRFKYDKILTGDNKFKKTLRARLLSDAKLEKTLGAKMYDAHCEIANIMAIELGGSGYPVEACHVEKIPQTGTPEFSDWVIDRLKLFSQWRALVARQFTPLHVTITKDVSFWGLNITETSCRHQKRRQDVSMALKQALNEWCILRGWGDQLAPKTKKEKPILVRTPISEQDTTRIVIFETEEE